LCFCNQTSGNLK